MTPNQLAQDWNQFNVLEILSRGKGIKTFERYVDI
jgi:hypothetical protein